MENKDSSCGLEQFASPEVPVEMIESWFIEAPPHGWDDIIGNGELKEWLRKDMECAYGPLTSILDRFLDISPVSCYVLYGLPGTGKTYLAGAVARELKEKYGFKLMRLQGIDIHCSLVGVAEKIIETAFAVAVAQAPCMLWVDDIDDVCRERSSAMEGYQKRLTVSFLQGYSHMRFSQKPVVLLGTTNDPACVEESLMNKATVLKIPLPDMEFRTHCFSKAFSRFTLEEGFAPEEMAAATEQFSYKELNRLCEYTCIKLKQQIYDTCTVLDETGNVDVKASDEAAVRKLQDGGVQITRALFRQCLQETPPSNKSRFLEIQQEYEAKYSL